MSCFFSSSLTEVKCRPGKGNCSPGRNFVEKKSHAESRYIIIFSTCGLFLISLRNSRGIANFVNTFQKSVSLHRCLFLFYYKPSMHSLLVANNLESSAIMNACSNAFAKDQGTQSPWGLPHFRIWLFTSQDTEREPGIALCAQIHLVSSFGFCSETDSPIAPSTLLLLLIFVSWETKYNSN